jgi:hypothetical protein
MQVYLNFSHSINTTDDILTLHKERRLFTTQFYFNTFYFLA